MMHINRFLTIFVLNIQYKIIEIKETASMYMCIYMKRYMYIHTCIYIMTKKSYTADNIANESMRA